MYELLIKYKNKKTLEAIMDLAKYFDFSVEATGKASKPKAKKVNGVTIISADSSVDISGLEAIFSNKNLDARKLRNRSWQRGR